MNQLRVLCVLFVSCVYVIPTFVLASEVEKEFQRVSTSVAELRLGFDEYFIGRKLNDGQKAFARKNRIEKSLAGTYKFKDGNTFIVAREDNHTVLGVYREYSDSSDKEIKNIVGDLMMRFDEPTTMAHDKLIYWAFDENGRISDEIFTMKKKDGGTDVLGLVKFVSSESFIVSSEKNHETEKVESEKPEKPSVYVIISSDPLSKLFLAMNQ